MYDGVIPMLKALKNDGKVLALATSKPTVFATQIVEKYGMAPYLEFVSGSELDGTNVDKASVIKIAMEKLGADKENTIMVGDREHDFIGAEKNRIKCVGVSYGFAGEGELEKCNLCKISDSVESLARFLLSV